jgi:hypothetical protein
MLEAQAGSINAEVVPVIAPGNTPGAVRAARAVAASFGAGVALRVGSEDLDVVEALLGAAGVGHESADLLVDFGAVVADDGRYLDVHRRLPRREDWRTVAFLGGSFPKFLTGLAVGQHLLPRQEWRAWRRLARHSGDRIPLFGDYTIQYVGHAEPVQFPNFSASIRYAAPEDWVIMRGEGVRNEGSAGYDQWPANAMLLRERPEYRGPDFSEGDRYIEIMGTDPPSTGGPGSWLRAGINHHMTLACRQAANLL